MIIDLKKPIQKTFPSKVDLCIFGAGPAGISLALTVSEKRPDFNVLLIEAGGFNSPTPDEKSSYSVESIGKDYSVLDLSRRRQFGGTSAHWGGWSKPLDPIDFTEHPKWNLSSWPIDRTDLDPFYRASLEWIEVNPDIPFHLRDSYSSLSQAH